MAKTNSICSVEGCDKASYSEGYCRVHHYRFSRHGDPLAGKARSSDIMRFCDSASAYEGDECLIWPYGKGTDGYGAMTANGKSIGAHRYICQMAHGDPPTPKHHAAHSCGKGQIGCVNPNHLSWKTNQENMDDMVAHGNSLRGENNPSSKLTEADVKEILLLKGKTSKSAVARMFSVSRPTISRIYSGRNWAWVE